MWAIGIAKTLSYTGAWASYLLSGKMINRFTALGNILFGNIYSRVINIIATVFPSIFSPILMSSTSLFYGVTSVARNTLFQKEFTDKQRATMSSINSFFGSIVYGVFAFGIGLIADKIGPGKSLLTLQLLAFPSLWLYWRIFKEKGQSKP